MTEEKEKSAAVDFVDEGKGGVVTGASASTLERKLGRLTPEARRKVQAQLGAIMEKVIAEESRGGEKGEGKSSGAPRVAQIISVERIPAPVQKRGRESQLRETEWWEKAERVLLNEGIPAGKALRVPILAGRNHNRMAAILRHWMSRRKLNYRVTTTKNDKEFVYIVAGEGKRKGGKAKKVGA